ncbi:MAG: hypothetical protein ABL878_08515 [Burkholderiales bacterium]
MKRALAKWLHVWFERKPVSIILFLGTLVLGVQSPLINASGTKDKLPAAESAAREIAIYALSRGKGVPEPTRAAYGKARKLIDDSKRRGEVLKVTETRIGLEGEKRLCFEAKDVAAARTLLLELRVSAEGVELFNVVVEPCLKK